MPSSAFFWQAHHENGARNQKYSSNPLTQFGVLKGDGARLSVRCVISPLIQESKRWKSFLQQQLSYTRDQQLTCSEVGFPSSSVGEESACNARDPGSISGSGIAPGEGNGNSFQYSCLENSMDRGIQAGNSPWGHKELDTTVRLRSEMASWSFFAFRQFGFELSFIHWPEMCATCPSPVPDIPMSGALAWHPVLRPHKVDRAVCSRAGTVSGTSSTLSPCEGLFVILFYTSSHFPKNRLNFHMYPSRISSYIWNRTEFDQV